MVYYFNEYVLEAFNVLNQSMMKDAEPDAKALYPGIAMLVACYNLIGVCSGVKIKQGAMTNLWDDAERNGVGSASD